ncbi:5-nucleotide phosphatase [Labrys sp. LIt4]|uniref:5'-nucleotidase, lipoprotein e(P4) family n=1 Tax=Labrys sp. LIt4 TaxID=2821355 RepID=UPI001AE0BEE9|nr:HAD family acid phosphatase [Labrys sp. LIt4]MBP0578838.1 5-nucleotide phosphatase [Labrys sp. LIt4]
MRGGLIGLCFTSALVAASAAVTTAAAEESAKPDDNLNAVLWDQTAVEARGNALAAFALARIRLDQALADPSWTAAPAEQTGDFKNFPPAIVLDVDDTLLNTSNYQAWNVKAGTRFTPETWTQYVKAQIDTPIAGAVEFTQYAASKGVKVFYVTNRTKEEEEPTVQLMTKLGFPTGGNVDTFLSAKEQPDWKSAKGTRRAVIAKDYRILLLVGDNFGDFTDAYKGTPEEREKVFAENAARWGHDWIVIANPTYGSFESAPYKGDYKLSVEEQRKLKLEALKSWDGK